MNSVQLVGRLTRDPEIKYTDGGVTIARYSVACDRPTNKGEADFINCISFGKGGEFIEKYFRQGMRIGLTGRIQTGSYTNKDGKKVYTTDVVTDRVEFVESKANSPKADANGFVRIPDDVDDEGVPFN